MTAPAPIRHPAPADELRLEWPGQCWVWALIGGWHADAHSDAGKSVHPNDYVAIKVRGRWIDVLRTRGPRPPWPTFIDQRDPGDERVEDDGFVTVYTGPSEGYSAQGARG